MQYLKRVVQTVRIKPDHLSSYIICHDSSLENAMNQKISAF